MNPNDNEVELAHNRGRHMGFGAFECAFESGKFSGKVGAQRRPGLPAVERPRPLVVEADSDVMDGAQIGTCVARNRYRRKSPSPDIGPEMKEVADSRSTHDENDKGDRKCHSHKQPPPTRAFASCRVFDHTKSVTLGLAENYRRSAL